MHAYCVKTFRNIKIPPQAETILLRRQTITTENRLTELLYFDRSDSKQIAGNSVEKQNISRRELDADFVSDFVIYAAVDYACKNVIAYFEFNGRFRAVGNAEYTSAAMPLPSTVLINSGRIPIT